jgi:hypothetical protein
MHREIDARERRDFCVARSVDLLDAPQFDKRLLDGH